MENGCTLCAHAWIRRKKVLRNTSIMSTVFYILLPQPVLTQTRKIIIKWLDCENKHHVKVLEIAILQVYWHLRSTTFIWIYWIYHVSHKSANMGFLHFCIVEELRVFHHFNKTMSSDKCFQQQFFQTAYLKFIWNNPLSKASVEFYATGDVTFGGKFGNETYETSIPREYLCHTLE